MLNENFKRTNIVIDEKKLKSAKKQFDIQSTRELVDFAISELLRGFDRKNILNLKGRIRLEIDLDKSRKTG